MNTLRRVIRTPAGCFAAIVLAIVAVVSVVSYFWLPQNPNYASGNVWQSPSAEHWLGTDGSGRDTASRLIAGSRVSFGVALATGALASVIGFALAMLGGLAKRQVREVVAVGIDVLVAFPTTLLAIMLTAVFGSGIPIVVAALGIAFGVSMGRVMRAEFRQVSSADFVVAAQVAGLSRSRILFRHLIPSVLPIYIVQVTWTMGTAVLAEASLSYLGFGAPKEIPSWGGMLASTQRFVSIYPETVLWPGLAITVTVLAFFLFGDQLRDALDMRDPVDETAEVPR